ncbi:MAG TPA: UDP-N-acetylmuramate dehydrogenase [Solirubrobacteraceae bacterium]|nr:UDP-N-acetylmuramate dehydrogenase [Solirubrobacteraceae bacterium]
MNSVPLLRRGVPLAGLTTIGLGGPATRLIEATADDQIIEAVAGADAAGEPLLLIAGGSNLVVADAGFDGTVIRILSRGVAAREVGGRVRMTVAAGEPWDELVQGSAHDGLAGIECLAGIPGSTGATPIQNVGAYGQQVASTVVAVRAYDRRAGCVVQLAAADCGFGYRTSRFRSDARFVVLEVTYELERSVRARPLRYPELARALGVGPGERPPLAEVREAVLALRATKGMVLSAHDPDSVSAGSFFLNPILPADAFAALERRVKDRLGEAVSPPAWPERDGATKTSAAWLIERAGFPRGYGEGRVGISTKHTLALVNRGGASTAELLALAREIRRGVSDAFAVTLEPEPTLIGVTLSSADG